MTSNEARALLRAATAVLIGMLIGCERSATEVAPPRLRNRLAEMRATQPTYEHVRPTPPPDANSLGCYRVVLTPDLRLSGVPTILRLTSVLRRESLDRRSYNVESRGIAPAFWSWQPQTKDEIRVNIGNGYSGWTFTLHRKGDDFEGTALWMNDTLSRRSATVRLVKISC